MPVVRRVRLRGIACAGVAAAALVLATAPAAFAHAAYKDSSPADGETVSSPPSQITAEFTEPITDSSYLEVYDPCGRQVDNGDSQISGYNMSITMSADTAGKYVVEFAAQSVDTHVTYGSFSFTSTGGAACAGEEPEEPAGGGGNPAGGGGDGGPSGGGGDTPAGSSGSGPAASGAETTSSGGGGGPAGSARGPGHRNHDMPRGPKKDGPAARRRDSSGPVSFENAAQRRAPEQEPAAWDLPIGGVLMALALCVMIGAAGGRVYAGIVAPPRR